MFKRLAQRWRQFRILSRGLRNIKRERMAEAHADFVALAAHETASGWPAEAKKTAELVEGTRRAAELQRQRLSALQHTFDQINRRSRA